MAKRADVSGAYGKEDDEPDSDRADHGFRITENSIENQHWGIISIGQKLGSRLGASGMGIAY